MIGPRPLLVKEARALVPLWAAAMAVIVAYPLTGYRNIQELAVLAFVFGSLAMGAHSIGHEYSHRTLAILLAQPVERRRILLTKFAVLAALLLSMGAAFSFLPYDIGPQLAPAIVFLPVIGGLFVAPWMTMVARNQLGGVMLTGLIGGWSMIATSVAAVKLSGLDAREAEQLGLVIWAGMMYAFAVISATVTWRTFMRLEAIEGGGRELHLPRYFTARNTARGGQPLWSLIRKELRLQQLTFAIAAIFVAIWMAAFLRSAVGDSLQAARPVLGVLSAIYLLAIGMTAGSLASAEERQSGMLESQQLLPVPAWQQWFIKAAVAIGLALLLGIGPPALLIVAGGPSAFVREMLPAPHLAALLIVIVTACGLYVSSLASSGVRALTLVFPFVTGLYLTLQFAASIMRSSRGDAVFFGAIPLAALLLFFAGSNHRRVDRNFSRAVLQIGAAAAVAAAGVPLLRAILDLTA